MGKLTWLVFSVLFACNLYARNKTVDNFHWIYLVVADYQESDRFTVERVPMIGCWGLMHGPEYSQFTRPYEVPVKGCGEPDGLKENINALSCAEITQFEENSDYYGTASLTLDISKCEYKESKNFIKAIKEAVAKSFKNPKGKPPVKLTIVK